MTMVTNTYVWNLGIKPIVGITIVYIGAIIFMKILEHLMVSKLEEKQ